MLRRAMVLVALSLLFVWPASAPAEPSHVHAELLADVASISSNHPFMLGVRLTIDPGWHVYWKNPGDAGMATHVKFTAPAGYTIGDLQFPTPVRFDQAGDIVAFGYEGSVLLLAEVTPPKEISPKDIAPDRAADRTLTTSDFSAAVAWLVCSKVCIPGKQTVDLKLPFGDQATPANVDLFEHWKAQLPVPAEKSPDIASILSTGSLHPDGDHASGSISIEIIWKTAAPDLVQFLPGSLDQYNIKQTKSVSDGKVTRITFAIETLAGQKAVPATLEAVAGYKNQAGDRRGIAFSVNLPDAGGGNTQ
jgi:DsbC/DsbD-like thiol-disulfide interchange protein